MTAALLASERKRLEAARVDLTAKLDALNAQYADLLAERGCIVFALDLLQRLDDEPVSVVPGEREREG